MLRDHDANEELGNWSGAVGEHGILCDRLHHRLKRIVKARAALDAQELECLREADRLRVWRRFGCASLVEYMERELGYSQRAAIERVRVMGAIAGLPAIEQALVQGALSFSAVREIARVATTDTEGDWLDAASDKTAREVETIVAGHKRGDRPSDPVDPALRRHVVRLELSAETYALMHQVRVMLEKELGQRLDEDAVLAAAFRHMLDVRSGCRTGPAYQIATTICSACKHGWQDGGTKTVEMSAAAIERAQCDAVHIGSLEPAEIEPDASRRSATPERPGAGSGRDAHGETGGSSAARPAKLGLIPGERHQVQQEWQHPAKPPRATWTIPPATRRKVLRRDHQRCAVPGCTSTRNLDLHHLEAQVGHVPSNLLTLCEAHHLAAHAGALKIDGDAADATFTRTHASNYTNATLALDTSKALRTLGFSPHEVKTAMARTTTHVGSSNLPLDHWIRIALSYCPKPTT